MSKFDKWDKDLREARQYLASLQRRIGQKPQEPSGLDRRADVQLARFAVGRDFSSLASFIGVTIGGERLGAKVQRRQKVIDKQSIIDSVFALRHNQVGTRGKVAVGGTVTRLVPIEAEGVYESVPEPSLVFELEWVPSIGERTFVAFQRNVTDLSERLCSLFAQKEIRITFRNAKRKEEFVISASPKGWPAPSTLTDDWLREAKKVFKVKGEEALSKLIAEEK